MSEATRPHPERPSPCWAITHGSALPAFGEVSEVPGPQSRKHPEKGSFATKPKEPMRGLPERRRLPAGADSAHSQVEGARITSCPPYPPSAPEVEGATYESHSRCSVDDLRPSTQLPLTSSHWQLLLVLFKSTTVRGPWPALGREQARD